MLGLSLRIDGWLYKHRAVEVIFERNMMKKETAMSPEVNLYPIRLIGIHMELNDMLAEIHSISLDSCVITHCQNIHLFALLSCAYSGLFMPSC